MQDDKVIREKPLLQNEELEKKAILEKFLLQNEELEKIESLLAEFNAIEMLGSVNAEIRHSNVLAWLLDPKSNHGFGEQFLRLFLKYVFANNRETIKSELTFFDIEFLDLDDIEVRKEWNRIDILLISESKKLIVAIENKIESTEHDGQLKRYYEIIIKEYPEYHKIFIYLTPEGLPPSDNENWIIFDYSTVYAILHKLLESRKNSISQSVYDFLKQYCTVLRRYIMPKSEIEEICKNIYKNHKEALNLIFQYKPDIELQVSEILQDEINSNKELVLDTAGKTETRFISRRLDEMIPRKGEGWGANNRILLFDFYNYNKRLVLRLYIGPGDKDIRTKLYSIAQKDTKLFNKAERPLASKWLAIYQREYLKPSDYEDSDKLELKEVISKKFANFLSDDLPKIENHIVKYW